MYTPLDFLHQQFSRYEQLDLKSFAKEQGIAFDTNLDRAKFSLLTYNMVLEQMHLVDNAMDFYNKIKDKNNDEIINYLYGGALKFQLNNIDKTPEEIAKSIKDNEDIRDAANLKMGIELTLGKRNMSMADVFDYTTLPFLFDKFSKNKQIYQLNSTFGTHLRQTNMSDFEINDYELSHLPCSTFWIDCSECDGFDSTVGMFVDVRRINSKMFITILDISHLETDKSSGYIFFSRYIPMDGLQVILDDLVKKSDEEKNNVVDTTVDKLTRAKFGGQEQVDSKLKNNPINSNILITLQLIKYMSMEERDKDIVPSEKTKSTYTPPKNPDNYKNKFSEVQIHDVGYVFGSTFDKYERKAKEEIKRREKEAKEEFGEIKIRKRPIPHYVSAHFHRFWCKDENKVNYLKTKWIEPYWTGVDKEDADKLVVIHKLTNSKITQNSSENSHIL